jgi:hypothetical protein
VRVRVVDYQGNGRLLGPVNQMAIEQRTTNNE